MIINKCQYFYFSENNTISRKEETCTVDEMLNIITFPSGGMTMLPSDGFNEVYPGIYLGEA